MTARPASPTLGAVTQPKGEIMDSPKDPVSSKVEAVLAARKKVFQKMGEKAWETVAGAQAIRLLGERESVTIDDIVAALEEEALTSDDFRVMNEGVIAHLRDLQARRRSI